jgi:hypothetical protein
MAPTFRHGKGSRAFLGPVNLSTVAVDVTWSAGVDAEDVTTYGDDDRNYIAGLRDGTADITAIFDGNGSTASADYQVATLLGSTAPRPLSFYPGNTTASSPARLGTVHVVAASVAAPADARVEATYAAQVTDGPIAGKIVRAHAAYSATSLGSTVDTTGGGMSTADPLIAHLHVTSVTASTASIILQHSSLGASWATLKAWTSITSTGYQTAELTGAKRYVRDTLNTVATGGLTYTVAVGRRNDV